MKQAMTLSALATAHAMVFAAADETGSGDAGKVEPVTIERLRQNGFTRPIAGTKTGLVWDIADEISAAQGRPALRDEVMATYKERVAGASDGTISTQYSRWCGFHGVQEILRKMRAEEKAAAEAEKAEAKAAKDAERAAAKEAKEAEKKRKADERAKAKAEKEAAAAAKKAEKEAAAKAKAEAEAAEENDNK